MKTITLIIAATVGLGCGPSFAQSGQSGVRVQSGHFCADNKCVRFSPDLQSATVQGRRPADLTAYDLRQSPVISRDTFREIFYLALRQPNAGSR